MAWTKQQQDAIDTRDKTLLVSAAAGSGKTATLTERIIQSILDDKNPMDIGRMLIATYTNAAVDELRERIGKAIKDAVLKNPENTRLEEQLLKLKDAKILTITAFCNTILRSSAQSVGLAPNYRIAEPAEAKILSSAVLEGLINAAYEGDIPDVCTPEEFIAVADCISNVKHSEGLNYAISFIFEKLTYSEKGIDTLASLISEYDAEKFECVEKTKMGAYIIEMLKSVMNSYAPLYRKLLSTATDARIDERNLPKAVSDLEYIEKILAETSYEKIVALLEEITFESPSKSVKETPTEFYLGFRFARSNFSEDIKKLQSDFFFYSEAEWKELYTNVYKLLNSLYKFLKKYNEVFMEEKRSRGVCEFADIERYAYEALCNPDGTPTPLAKEISEKFDAIYVDEYQDVNALEGCVFAAISKPNNRFMVGDIKQSIYGFRSARPEIFLGMKNLFPPLEEAKDSPAASIFMSNNFRCDEMVVDFVNGVFDTMFRLFAEGIGYVESDRLEFSKKYDSGDTPVRIVPEIHVIEKPPLPKGDDGDDDDEVSAVIKEERNNAKLQARCIVNKISELLENGRLANGKPIRPKDVAILMRSVKSELAKAITDALTQHGIPSSINETGDLFVSEEVLLALSFLYSIDNPRKDIYLCSVMLSPLFGFTPDEILKIRRSSDKETLWEALGDYVKTDPAYSRGRGFIASILKYRRLAEGTRADALISMIYRESGLMTLASANGGRDNLILLHSYARKYEADEFKGLYSFISYINAVLERGETFPAASVVDENDAVRIMTIHKSKGLEFPVTILAGASSVGSNRSGRIFFHENFGIAIKTKDDSGLAVVDNPVTHAIQHYIRSVEFDEELRVLYVALTRAREQLYVYGMCPKKTADDYVDYVDRMRDALNPYFASKAKSFLNLIMISRTCGKLVIESPAAEEGECESTAITSEGKLSLYEPDVTSEEYKSRFSFRYANSHLEKLPKKISVSRLSPAMLDTDESAVGLDELSVVESFLHKETRTEDTVDPEAASLPILPRFITGKDEGESAKRGIATHKVLQFCDFENLEKSAEDELKRLVEKEFITTDDGKRVRLNELRAFTESELFSEIKNSKALHRELRFNVFFSASEFTDESEKKSLLENEKILVQGVIDCLIENERGELHLVDYKTDRLTKEELRDPESAEKRLKEKHTPQLTYYKAAVEQIFGKAPSSVGIYSLHLGKEILLDI